MKDKKKILVTATRWLMTIFALCAITVVSERFVYADESFYIDVYTTTSDDYMNDYSGGNLFVPYTQEAGTTVTVSATPNSGYYLAQVRYEYWDANNNTVFNAVTPVNGVYSFTMPSSDVTVYGDFVTIKWDGTIDVTWYDPSATTYNIQYAAQLAGVAAITNGIFNNYPTIVNSSNNIVPYVKLDGTPYGSNKELYNMYGAWTDMTNTTRVVGDISYIKAASFTRGNSDDSQVTTTTYWFGGMRIGADIYLADFTGKTINLTADIDMGGKLAAGSSEFVLSNWSGPNYMPIGGQYLMYNSNGYTHLGSSFNGTFDGQGHIVDNIYCQRYATTGYGDSESVGLIGRLGVHEDEPYDWNAYPVVKNVAVDGIIYARRSVGGIVGKTGRSNGATIENCMNFATVQNTDSGGVGGIVGTGWNDITIRNCANFGYINAGYRNAGGISGSCKAEVINCYNLGYVGAPSNRREQAQALGTNSGGAIWTNCYWLSGSSSAVIYSAVYGNTAGSTITMISTVNGYKDTEFLAQINSGGSSWMTGTTGNLTPGVANAFQSVHSLSSSLSAFDCLGVPVPSTF